MSEKKRFLLCRICNTYNTNFCYVHFRILLVSCNMSRCKWNGSSTMIFFRCLTSRNPFTPASKEGLTVIFDEMKRRWQAVEKQAGRTIYMNCWASQKFFHSFHSCINYEMTLSVCRYIISFLEKQTGRFYVINNIIIKISKVIKISVSMTHFFIYWDSANCSLGKRPSKLSLFW